MTRRFRFLFIEEANENVSSNATMWCIVMYWCMNIQGKLYLHNRYYVLYAKLTWGKTGFSYEF